MRLLQMHGILADRSICQLLIYKKTFDTVDYDSLLRKLLEFAVMVWVAISENF